MRIPGGSANTLSMVTRWVRREAKQQEQVVLVRCGGIVGLGAKEWSFREDIRRSGYKVLAAFEEATGRSLMRTRWGVRLLAFARSSQCRAEDPMDRVTVMRDPWLLLVRYEPGPARQAKSSKAGSLLGCCWCSRCAAAMIGGDGPRPVCQQCMSEQGDVLARACGTCRLGLQGSVVQCATCGAKAHGACANAWSNRGAKKYCTQPSCVPWAQEVVAPAYAHCLGHACGPVHWYAPGTTQCKSCFRHACAKHVGVLTAAGLCSLCSRPRQARGADGTEADYPPPPPPPPPPTAPPPPDPSGGAPEEYEAWGGMEDDCSEGAAPPPVSAAGAGAGSNGWLRILTQVLLQWWAD